MDKKWYENQKAIWLDNIMQWRGVLREIRCDNGPEYISGHLQEWDMKHGIAIRYIQPGKPQQNGYVERYNRTVLISIYLNPLRHSGDGAPYHAQERQLRNVTLRVEYSHILSVNST